MISLAVAYGFWVGSKWAWWLGIVLAILDLISVISGNYLSFIIGLVMLYYLTRHHVKVWFHESQ